MLFNFIFYLVSCVINYLLKLDCGIFKKLVVKLIVNIIQIYVQHSWSRTVLAILLSSQKSRFKQQPNKTFIIKTSVSAVNRVGRTANTQIPHSRVWQKLLLRTVASHASSREGDEIALLFPFTETPEKSAGPAVYKYLEYTPAADQWAIQQPAPEILICIKHHRKASRRRALALRINLRRVFFIIIFGQRQDLYAGPDPLARSRAL